MLSEARSRSRRRHSRRPRVFVRLVAVALAVTIASFTAHIWAQPAERRPLAGRDEAYPNFDIRVARGAATEYFERVVDDRAIVNAGAFAGARIGAVGRLQASGKPVDIAESAA